MIIGNAPVWVNTHKNLAYLELSRRHGEDVLVRTVVGEEVDDDVEQNIEQTCHEIGLRKDVQGQWMVQ